MFEDFEYLVLNYFVNAIRNHDHENWAPENIRKQISMVVKETKFVTAVENRVEFSSGGFFGLIFPFEKESTLNVVSLINENFLTRGSKSAIQAKFSSHCFRVDSSRATLSTQICANS